MVLTTLLTCYTLWVRCFYGQNLCIGGERFQPFVRFLLLSEFPLGRLVLPFCLGDPSAQERKVVGNQKCYSCQHQQEVKGKHTMGTPVPVTTEWKGIPPQFEEIFSYFLFCLWYRRWRKIWPKEHRPQKTFLLYPKIKFELYMHFYNVFDVQRGFSCVFQISQNGQVDNLGDW